MRLDAWLRSLSRLGSWKPDEPPSELRKRIVGQLMRAGDRVGNFRVDQVTLALSNDLSSDSGYMILAIRGLYDRQALRQELEDLEGTVSMQDGIPVVSIGTPGSVILASDEQLILVVGPPGHTAEPLGKMVAALRAGKGSLEANRGFADLLRSVDRRHPVWAATNFAPFAREFPPTRSLTSLVLTAQWQEGSLVASGVLKAKQAETLDGIAAILEIARKQAIEECESQSTVVPLMETVAAALRSFQHERKGDSLVLSARVRELQELMMLPMATLLGPPWF
jgi:hypothetical protein